MYHIIKDDIYYLYSDLDEELMTIKFDNSIDGNQVVITTKDEIYAGPISLINFSADISKE